jgi:hypothetical protein
MNPMEAAAATKKQQERETLRNVIAQWNANRLDLFELSEPNEVSLLSVRVTAPARASWAVVSSSCAKSVRGRSFTSGTRYPQSRPICILKVPVSNLSPETGCLY